MRSTIVFTVGHCVFVAAPGLQNDVYFLPERSMSSLETRVDGPCQGTGESFWISRGIMVYRCSRCVRAGFAPLAIAPY